MTAARMIFGIAAAIGALGAWGACHEYVVATSTDAGADSASTSSGGPATPLPPGTGTTSSSSGNYPPIFKASWDGVADAGIPVPSTSSCAGVGSSGAALNGSYQAIAGCFDQQVFVTSFQKYCAGTRVTNAAGLVNSKLSVTSGGSTNSLLRSGNFKVAGELSIPCKEQFQNSCVQLQSALLLVASQGGGDYDYDIKCYDSRESASACVCQMEMAGDYPDEPFVINATARTMSDGSRVLEYGFAPPNLTRVKRTDDTDAVPFENCLVLDYAQN